MHETQNQLSKTWLLTAIVAAILVAVSTFSSDFFIGQIPVKKADILADIRAEKAEPLTFVNPTDSTKNDTFSVKRPQNCPDSTVCFEDFSSSAATSFARFFQKIDSLKTSEKQVRVAWFGDSFVEGDIVLAAFRDSLQKIWGGRGVGFLPMTGATGGLMRSVSYSSGNGWETFGIVKNDAASSPAFGVSGFVYRPKSTASWSEFSATRFYPITSKWSRARIFYQKSDSLAVAFKINDGEKVIENGRFGPDLQVFEAKNADFKKFSCSFGPVENLNLFGVSLDDERGFYVDNFSVRGNTGGKMKKLRPDLVRAFDEKIGFDLVVLQYGMNAIQPSKSNLKYYEIELDELCALAKKLFPERPILLVSCPDRGGKVRGEMATMEAVPMLVAMQKRLAEKHGFVFLNLFEAMGGAGTMLKLAAAEPKILAYKDFTHLTHEGGDWLGKKLAAAFLAEKAKFENEKTPR